MDDFKQSLTNRIGSNIVNGVFLPVKSLGTFKPLIFSFLFGVMVFSFILSIGFWAPPQAIRSHEKHVHLSIQDLASALTLAELSLEEGRAQAPVQSYLARLVSLPYIIGAQVENSRGKVIARVESPGPQGDPSSSLLSIPMKDAQGSLLGTALVSVNWSESPFIEAFVKRARFFALTGGIFSFFLLWIFLSRKEKNLGLIKDSLFQIASGNLDQRPLRFSDPDLKPIENALTETIESLRERERMRHSLGRIMDPKIAEILIKENPKLGGRRRQATILFCDIRNYTSICEEMDVDELQKFLNQYWEGTVEIIMEQEGTVDKFHGDGICVIFGAPILHPDDPLRAARTAWRLVENVKKLNEERTAQRKTPIQIGVGIHSGEVIAGHIGSERRMDYTVVGDVVNVAARIEELNKKYGTQILISDNVYEKIEKNVRVKTLSLAYLRGHKRPILVHALREFFEVPADVKTPKAA